MWLQIGLVLLAQFVGGNRVSETAGGAPPPATGSCCNEGCTPDVIEAACSAPGVWLEGGTCAGTQPCCVTSHSGTTLWTNYDDDDCSSDLTTYSPDATNEIGWDATISIAGSGNSRVSSGADSGYGSCGISVNNASDNSYYPVQDHFGDVDYAGGSAWWEIARVGGTTLGPARFFNFGDTGSLFEASWVNTGDFEIVIAYSGGTITLTTNGGSCDDVANNTSWHVINVRWQFDNNSGTDFARLYVDGTECDADTGTARTAVGGSDGDDWQIGAPENDTGTWSMDRNGYNTSSSFDAWNSLIFEECVNYDSTL